MVKEISEIQDILKEHSNMDEYSRDIILFNLMSGSCGRNCPNCYDRVFDKENMSKETFKHYLKLISEASQMENSNVSNRLSTIASKIIKYDHLQDYLECVQHYGFKTAVYASDLDNNYLKHPVIDLIYFHITNSIEDVIKPFTELESEGKRIDLRFNFSADGKFKDQAGIIYRFLNELKTDAYLLRYSVSAKTKNEDSKHFTPESFASVKQEFFDELEQMAQKYPNMKFRAERPFFRCNFSPDEISRYSQRFGLSFDCVMEFTIAPNGLCGLCPPVTLFQKNGSRPSNVNEFNAEINSMRKMHQELSEQPSFEVCKTCTNKCQGGCLSYKF